ncbi:InlB B-repeat-containing protein [Candidatus Saccharibacteria bacterium]|nr:InlB B-repeat-containing protein [Candidatus Saccharibacteria bacterium]
MRVWRGKVLLLVSVFFMILMACTGASVWAEDETISISISDDSVVMNLMQGEFGEESQIITAWTSNEVGYTVGMRTTGTSSALTNVADNSYTIPTFTLPTGTESIPVDELDDGYGYSIDGGENYLPVPEPSAVKTTTLFKTTSAGQNQHELTFGVNVPMDTAVGTYTNTFVIEIVSNLEPCAMESICYFGNGDDGDGVMEDQEDVVSGSSVMLSPSNFSKPGYGFAGWNTAMDGSGTDYGPSQTITVGDLSEEGLQLYAKWVQSEGDLQGWRGCETMNEGDVTALTDTRDGNAYAVAKYADGKCWMMENLRLDLSNPDVTISTQNTNKPKSDFITLANAHPVSSDSFCNGGNAGCVDRVLYNTNNINRNKPASPIRNDSNSSWYSYGVYYNYYTATAGNGGYDLTTKGAQVNGDICPMGWRMPTGYIKSNDLGTLDVAYGGTGVKQDTDEDGPLASERWRAYPLNYIYSGEYRDGTGYNRGNSTGMNSANNYAAISTYNLWIRSAGVNMTANNTSKLRGQTVRCLARDTITIVGNVHYDSNGGTGTMNDQTGVDFATAVASSNQFTRANYRFTGWNTRSNGSGVAVSEGGALDTAATQSQLVDGDTLTLYAMWQPVYRVVYAGNGADAGSMASVTQEDVPSIFNLIASNYSKDGYGFAGWSADANAGTKLLNHESVTVYGPNQVVKLDNTFTSNADANNQITLYAVWLPADTTDTMQSFSSTRCATMNTGEYLALRDERDNDVYAVSKLADGHCWMTENLRLTPSAVAFSTTNTNSPTADFITEAVTSQDSNTLCNTDSSACIDQVLFNANDINRGSNLTPSPSDNGTIYSWYSYGVMYGWYTATVGNGNYDMASGNVAGDICPAGWRLPTGGGSGEYVSLTNAVGGANNMEKNNNLLAFPNNFIYSGDYNYNTSGGRGTYGRYWSATPNGKAKAFRLGVAQSNWVTPDGSWNKWDAFAVRCVVK